MYEILPYKQELKDIFDRFITEESVNGTFLHTRAFLDYHPKERFQDASFAVHKSGTLALTINGNVTTEGAFESHLGSTFGGPVFSKDFYSASRVLEILKFVDIYLQKKFKSVRFKITPALFSLESPDLIEYALEHLGYTRHTELSAYTLLDNTDPLNSCKKDCRRIFRASEKFNPEYRSIESDNDFELFYKYLEISKAKYGIKPVHTLNELYDLKHRLPQNICFKGLFVNGEYVAGIMLFSFFKARIIHAQYIAANENFNTFQGATALYVRAMREAKKNCFDKFSWGISTENHGAYLNESLFRFKESFGAKASVNVTYEKSF